MKATDRVLIAGAGPVGLVTALGLSRRGIPVTVFEAVDDLPMDLRASTIHPAMLEELGVIERVLTHGTRSPLWQYRDRATSPVAVFDLTILSDETPTRSAHNSSSTSLRATYLRP
jgi:3-(3-hydroxy-phenyl)propionate hydroxylase